MTAPSRLTLRRPDDWHLHLRDGAMLRAVAPLSARHFGRALIMPNLVPPVVTASQARAYRDRILAAVPDGRDFQPRMTLYLTEATDADDVARAAAEGVIAAVKLYPAGATTNSDGGVRDLRAVYPVLERMQAIGLPLCVHGEVTDPEVDIFDREAVFLERVLAPLRAELPELIVTLEHITTAEGVAYVTGAEGRIAGTITAHHLAVNRTHMLAGGIRPHQYCLPILKRESHRRALVGAATSGTPRLFLGTDSAPHLATDKEAACGCAGCFTAPHALPIVAQIFEEAGALDRLEGFVSLTGAAHYGEAPAAATLTLRRAAAAQPLPAAVETGAGRVEAFDPGRPIYWRVEE